MKAKIIFALLCGAALVFFKVDAAPAAENETAQASVTGSDASAKPISEDEVAKGISINKERISLDLKGIDVGELFRILSQKMGLTIVPTKSVSGRINIFLNNLTFADALDVILISQDLASDRHGEIINIMTSGEYEKLYGKKYSEKRVIKTLKLKYAKPTTVFNALSQVKSDIGKVIIDEASGTIIMIDIPEKIALMEKSVKDLDQAPQTEVFDLEYAKPADMKAQLSSAITPGAGEVYVDERSSKVMVSDLPDKMKKIKRMVRAFDAETKEVYLEAEIVQLTLKDEYQRGINWEKLFKSVGWKNLTFIGSFAANPSWTLSPAATSDNQQITLGTFATDTYTGALTLLQNLGNTKIISSPRIAAINGQEAKVLVGSREAYITSSQSQAEATTVTSESVEFIDVGVKLNIVPTINADGYIIMKIKPEISSVRETLTSSLGSKIPIVETSEAETVVKVKDGATVMIAGLRKQDKRAEGSGVPFLQKIPLVGVFFGSRATRNQVTELIVFVTPHIIKGDTMLAGSEPEKVLPADIMPAYMKEEIISRTMVKEKMAPPEPDKMQEAIKDKAKGLKAY